ncbi:MAG: DUF4406 domain-containing protein [Pseudoalteromonas tetraodonis]
MRIYIAGPVSNLPQFNIDAFRDAETKLIEMGHAPIVPHDLFVEQDLHPVEDYNLIMRQCLKEMLNCDAVVLLDSWRFSNGARIEQQTAQAVGIKTYPIEDFVNLKKAV